MPFALFCCLLLRESLSLLLMRGAAMSNCLVCYPVLAVLLVRCQGV